MNGPLYLRGWPSQLIPMFFCLFWGKIWGFAVPLIIIREWANWEFRLVPSISKEVLALSNPWRIDWIAEMNSASLEPISLSIAFFTPGLVVKGPGVNNFLSSKTTFGPVDLLWMVSMISEMTAKNWGNPVGIYLLYSKWHGFIAILSDNWWLLDD